MYQAKFPCKHKSLTQWVQVHTKKCAQSMQCTQKIYTQSSYCQFYYLYLKGPFRRKIHKQSSSARDLPQTQLKELAALLRLT